MVLKFTGTFTDFKNPTAKMIAKEIAKGGNWNWLSSGVSGSGKSTMDLRIIYDFDRDLNGKRRINPENLHEHVFFTSKDLIKGLYEIPDNKKGYGFSWEEAGGLLGANSRQWWSKMNKDIAEVFQICRIKGALLMINVQSINFLDKSIRTVLHMHSKCRGIVSSENDGKYYVNTQTSILKPHYYKPEQFALPLSYMNYESGLRHLIKEFRIPIAPDPIYSRFKELELSYKRTVMESKFKT